MTVPSTARRAGPFTGTGVLASYPFTFKVFEKADLLVVVADTSGLETALVLDSTVLVTLNVDQDATPGGSVQYAVGGVATALPSGYSLVITGEGLEYEQTADLPQGGNFSPEVIENALDRLMMLLQLQRDAASRSLQVPVTTADVDVVLPAPVGSQLLGWNVAGTAIINYASDVNGAAGLQALLAAVNSILNGDNLVGHYDQVAPSYSKTVGEMLRFLPINVLMCMPQGQRAAISDFTSTYDCATDISNMMTIAASLKRAWFWWPEGKYCLASMLTVTNGSFKWTGYGRRSFGSTPSNSTGVHIVALNNTGLLRIDPGVAFPTDICIESMGFYGTGAGSNIDGIIVDDAWGVTLRDVVVDFFTREGVSAQGTSGAYGLKMIDCYVARCGRANVKSDISFCEITSLKTDAGQYGLLGTANAQGLGVNGECHFEGATVAALEVSGQKTVIVGGRIVGNTNGTVCVNLFGDGSTCSAMTAFASVGSGATNSFGLVVTGLECAVSGVRFLADTALKASSQLCQISGVYEGSRAGAELLDTGAGRSMLSNFTVTGLTNSILHTSGVRRWRIGPGEMLDAATGAFKAMTITAGVPLIEAMTPKPLTYVSASAAQSIPNNAYTAVQFNTDDFDNWDQHDPATNNTRITAKVPAAFEISYSLSFAPNAAGTRTGRIRKNGATDLLFLEDIASAGAADATTIQGSFIVRLSATEYIEMEAFQSSGGALNTNNGKGLFLAMKVVGDS